MKDRRCPYTATTTCHNRDRIRLPTSSHAAIVPQEASGPTRPLRQAPLNRLTPRAALRIRLHIATMRNPFAT